MQVVKYKPLNNDNKIEMLQSLIDLAHAGELGDIAICYEDLTSALPVVACIAQRFFISHAACQLSGFSIRYEDAS